MSRSAGLCNFDQCDWTRELSHLQFFGDKLNIFRNLNFACNKPFEHFMGIWFLCITGATAVFTLYPIMMQELYGIGQTLLSLNFAIAMGISVFLYDWAGHLSHRFGPMRILQSFLGVRLIAFLAFLLPGMFHFNGSVKLILLSFSVVVLCWPFIIVSGTALAALLFPSGEGKGMGIFYAVLALACISGSTIGGWLAAQWGFTATAGMAVITESLGLIFIYKTGGEKAVNTAISQVSDVQQQLNRW
jgi:predicted MFS family arabinose efflux permease